MSTVSRLAGPAPGVSALRRGLARLGHALWRPWLRRRLGRTSLETVEGLSLVVLPEVFNPAVFRTGIFLARAVNELPELAPDACDQRSAAQCEGRAAFEHRPAASCADSESSAPASPWTSQPKGRVAFEHRPQTPAPRASGESGFLPAGPHPAKLLDLGTGSGVGAIFAARRGFRVTAVDVNPQAVRCARINAMIHGFEERMEVLEGDLFEPVAGRRFDRVLFNPPFFRGAPRDSLDRAWRGTDVLERFAAGLEDALAPGGIALLVLSSDGAGEELLEDLRAKDFEIAPAARRVYGTETLTAYRIGRAEP